MSLYSSWRPVLALLLSAGLILAAGLRQDPHVQKEELPVPQNKYPEFSWEKVPVYAHTQRTEGTFTDEQIRFLASHYRFLTIEKSHGFGKYGNTQDAFLTDLARLKEANPDMKVLFYLNTFIDYRFIREAPEVNSHPDWILKDPSGKPLMKNGRTRLFDLSNPELRAWWISVAQKMTDSGADGLFTDAIMQPSAPFVTRPVGAAKAQELRQGLITLLEDTRKAIGPDKLMLGNFLRGSQFDPADYLRMHDGGMLEHFDFMTAQSKEAMAEDIALLETLGRQGKIVLFKGWPDFSWLDSEMMKKSHEELAQLAREQIVFPLAAFLVGAQEQSYFCYTWGYTDRDGAFEWYPELDKPLGKPLGEATRNGWVYTREFAHARVWVDLESKQAKIDWH